MEEAPEKIAAHTGSYLVVRSRGHLDQAAHQTRLWEVIDTNVPIPGEEVSACHISPGRVVLLCWRTRGVRERSCAHSQMIRSLHSVQLQQPDAADKEGEGPD